MNSEKFSCPLQAIIQTCWMVQQIMSTIFRKPAYGPLDPTESAKGHKCPLSSIFYNCHGTGILLELPAICCDITSSFISRSKFMVFKQSNVFIIEFWEIECHVTLEYHFWAHNQKWHCSVIEPIKSGTSAPYFWGENKISSVALISFSYMRYLYAYSLFSIISCEGNSHSSLRVIKIILGYLESRKVWAFYTKMSLLTNCR